jgi:hypothetical protein
MNIDNIKDADDAFAYLEKLAGNAKQVGNKLSEIVRQQMTYHPADSWFVHPVGNPTVAIDAVTSAKCHKLSAAAQDFYTAVMGKSF